MYMLLGSTLLSRTRHYIPNLQMKLMKQVVLDISRMIWNMGLHISTKLGYKI